MGSYTRKPPPIHYPTIIQSEASRREITFVRLFCLVYCLPRVRLLPTLSFCESVWLHCSNFQVVLLRPGATAWPCWSRAFNLKGESINHLRHSTRADIATSWLIVLYDSPAASPTTTRRTSGQLAGITPRPTSTPILMRVTPDAIHLAPAHFHVHIRPLRCRFVQQCLAPY